MTTTVSRVISLDNAIESIPTALSLSNDFNITWDLIPDIQELFLSFGSLKFSSDYIIIDVDRLSELGFSSIYEVIHSLETVLKCTKYDNAGIQTERKTRLVAEVGVGVDIKYLVELLSIPGHTVGLVVRGPEFSYEDIRKTYSALFSGSRYVPELLKSKMARKKKTTDNSTFTLTPRQNQIMHLVVDRGASNKAIARMLHISESTVKLHVSAVMRKYGVRSRTQLAVYGRQRDLN